MHPKHLTTRKEIREIANDPSVLDFTHLLECAKKFRCLDHPLRQQILRVIKVKQPITVTQLFMLMGTDQSVMSRNLDMLRQENLLLKEKIGRYVLYSVNEAALEKVLQTFGNTSIAGQEQEDH